MDIHQKLILIAFICFAFTGIIEYVFPDVWKKSWWHPISIKNKLGQEIYYPATPTLIGVTFLIIALVIKE